MSDRIPIQHWWLGGLSFFVCYVAHVGWWRKSLPRRDVVALAGLFFVLPAFGLTGWMLISGSGLEVLAPILTHLLVSANYLAVYPALQASSPTIQLMTLLSKTPEGMSLEEIERALAKPELLRDRLNDLTRGKLVETRTGLLRLRPTGAMLATLFLWYRRFLGLPVGEG